MLISCLGEMNHVTPILKPCEPHPLGFQTQVTSSCFMAFYHWSWLPCCFLQLAWAKNWQIYGHLRWNTVSNRRAFSWFCILPNVKHADCIHHFENRTSHVFCFKNHVVFPTWGLFTLAKSKWFYWGPVFWFQIEWCFQYAFTQCTFSLLGHGGVLRNNRL